MIGVAHRAGRALAATVLGLFVLATIGAAPASADPTAVVTPTNVVDGQTVDIQFAGFPADAGIGMVTQCSAAVLGSPSQWLSYCRFGLIHFNPPAQATLTVFSQIQMNSTTTFNCHVAPGCVVGFSNAAGTASAWAPIVFAPDLAPTPPARNLTDGDTVHVTGGGTPPAGATVAQCDKAILDDPTSADALCAASTPLVGQPGGGMGADVVVHDPFVATTGADLTCGYDNCVIVLGPVTGSPVPNVAISFGPVSVTVEPSDHVLDGQGVSVHVAGAPVAGIQRAQCLLPLGANVAASQCVELSTTSQQDRWGNVATSVTADIAIATPQDCATGGCGVAVADVAGEWLAPAVPLTFAFIAFTSGDGPYLDGDAIGVAGSGLAPGNEYLLQHCYINGPDCDDGFTVTVAADGTVDTSIPAAQRMTSTNGDHFVCRIDPGCFVSITDATADQLLISQHYSMAEGSLAASPATGLSDGQTVQITGTDLMSSYNGPVVWFPTGGWVLTQCDRDVYDGGVTLYNVFAQCATLPPTRPVDIPGSTLDTTIDVEATITKILGGTTDCAAEPDACVVGLVRWEQDATVTAYLTPISFGP